MIRIGISSCMIHPDPERALFKGKRLLYMEESMFHWVMEEGAIAALVPTEPEGTDMMDQIVSSFDGILLSGGIDVAPEAYGESALQPEWQGDAWRDAYEIKMVHAALKLDIPLLGICRGAQILNVALGGSMYQDINTQTDGSLVHRDWDIYDQNFHELIIDQTTALAKMYPNIKEAKINSVHHQAIKGLGKGLEVEARSKRDHIIEAIRHEGPQYALGIQWHPEFQDANDKSILDRSPIMRDFLAAISQRK